MRIILTAIWLLFSTSLALAQIAPPPPIFDAITFRGGWNAATNTPTLANGVGLRGDMYRVATAGSQNLGGGSVAYVVGEWLMYDGTEWDLIGVSNAPVSANPTAQVGLTTVVGVAETYMRSDAAPAINQAIAPTWTGGHTFALPSGLTSPSLQIASVNPQLELRRTDAGVDAGRWNFGTSGAGLFLRALNDAGNVANDILSVTRNSGTTINAITIGPSGANSATIVWNGENAPWQRGASGTGNPGDVWASTGNATSPSWQTQYPIVVATGAQSAQQANVNQPSFFAVPASGTYRASCFVVLTQAATTSSTLPQCNVAYTEAATSVAVQDLVTQTANLNQVGLHTNGTTVIEAQTGTNVGYSTSSYASAGATAMHYQVRVTLERLR